MNFPYSTCIALMLLATSGCTRAPETETTPDLTEIDIAGLQEAMAAGTLSAREVTQWSLDRIAAVDDAGPTLNAVIATNPDALAIADERDAERRAGRIRGPLHGIPVLIKDNIDTGDRLPTTAGSLALTGAPALRDAEIVRRLREAGAVILGKTNLSEWANIRSTRSSSGWSAVGGQTRNPHVLDRSPCGSSSGSGAAVAAGFVAAAIGTETDGSILCPASTNGIVGFKPTVGLVSRRGIVPISRSQDTAGPMTRTVADAAILLDALAGVDPADQATAMAEGRTGGFQASLQAASLKGRRFGIVRNHGGGPAAEPVLELAIATLKAQGAEIIDPVVLRPAAEYSEDELAVLLFELKADLAAYLTGRGTHPLNSLTDVIAFNEREAATELRWFGQELFLEAERKGGLDTAEYRNKSARIRRLAGAEGIDDALGTHQLDALVAVTCGPAWSIDLVLGDNRSATCSTPPAAVAGYPSVSVPGGFVHGLPVGVSFFAGAWQDAKLLGIAHAFEYAHAARRQPAYLTTMAYDSAPEQPAAD
ncbi:MAG TPA: amidase [Steroidobacteraceae bacterium]|nr:amidase [Steroidobacteraceae bacterium]